MEIGECESPISNLQSLICTQRTNTISTAAIINSARASLLAEAMMLPSEEYVSDQMKVVDVEGIHAARNFVKRGLAMAVEEDIRSRYDELDDGSAYDKSSVSMGRRSLKNVCLSYLLETPGGEAIALRHLENSDNMTDTLAALKGLVWSDTNSAAKVLADLKASGKTMPWSWTSGLRFRPSSRMRTRFTRCVI